MLDIAIQIIGYEVSLNPKPCLLNIYPENVASSKNVRSLLNICFFFESLTIYSLRMENRSNLCHSSLVEVNDLLFRSWKDKLHNKQKEKQTWDNLKSECERNVGTVMPVYSCYNQVITGTKLPCGHFRTWNVNKNG